MFKNFGKIFVNRLKVGAVDFLMDACISSIQEYRRANQSGEFDLHKKSNDMSEPNSEVQKSSFINPFKFK